LVILIIVIVVLLILFTTGTYWARRAGTALRQQREDQRGENRLPDDRFL
jgi:uncharacterized membrane protein